MRQQVVFGVTSLEKVVVGWIDRPRREREKRDVARVVSQFYSGCRSTNFLECKHTRHARKKLGRQWVQACFPLLRKALFNLYVTRCGLDSRLPSSSNLMVAKKALCTQPRGIEQETLMFLTNRYLVSRRAGT